MIVGIFIAFPFVVKLLEDKKEFLSKHQFYDTDELLSEDLIMKFVIFYLFKKLFIR